MALLAPRSDEKRSSKPATVDDNAKSNGTEQSVETEIGFLNHDPADDVAVIIRAKLAMNGAVIRPAPWLAKLRLMPRPNRQ